MARSIYTVTFPERLIKKIYKHSLDNLKEARVSMLDNTPLTIFFDGSIAFYWDLTVLYIELLKASAVVGHALNTPVRHKVTHPETELLEVGTRLCESSETGVRDVALPDVEGSQSRTGSRDNRESIVWDSFAASSVEVPQLIASTCYHLQTSIAHLDQRNYSWNIHSYLVKR